jgi:hypothetical protein
MRSTSLAMLDVEEVLATVEALVARRLRQRGLAGAEDDAASGWADEAPLFAELAVASIDGRSALGASLGARPTQASANGSIASAATCCVRRSLSIGCT